MWKVVISTYNSGELGFRSILMKGRKSGNNGIIALRSVARNSLIACCFGKVEGAKHIVLPRSLVLITARKHRLFFVKLRYRQRIKLVGNALVVSFCEQDVAMPARCCRCIEGETQINSTALVERSSLFSTETRLIRAQTCHEILGRFGRFSIEIDIHSLLIYVHSSVHRHSITIEEASQSCVELKVRNDTSHARVIVSVFLLRSKRHLSTCIPLAKLSRIASLKPIFFEASVASNAIGNDVRSQ